MVWVPLTLFSDIQIPELLDHMASTQAKQYFKGKKFLFLQLPVSTIRETIASPMELEGKIILRKHPSLT